ncbi:MAG: J domain-containing protein [Chloroflexi bacterium]|nr:J domain-containing protein [Chloroflexota bacterium]
MKNYYKILGIKAGATTKEINAAYERLLDWQVKFPESYSEQRKQEIDEAYDKLINPITREEYDQQLSQYEAKRREQQRQASGRTNRYQPPPPTPHRPQPPPPRKSVVRWDFERRAIAVLIGLLIWVWLGTMAGGETKQRPTPFVFPTPGNTPTVNRTPTQPPPTRVVITSTPRPTIVLVGQRCSVRNVSGQELPVYAETDTGSTVVAQLSVGATVFAVREHGQWYSVSGQTLAQSNDGYIEATEIEVNFCQ